MKHFESVIVHLMKSAANAIAGPLKFYDIFTKCIKII